MRLFGRRYARRNRTPTCAGVGSALDELNALAVTLGATEIQLKRVPSGVATFLGADGAVLGYGTGPTQEAALAAACRKLRRGGKLE